MEFDKQFGEKVYLQTDNLSRKEESTLKTENYKINENSDYPELTMRMFFEFMRTAYQVNDSFEELATVLSANSEIDWNQLAKTQLTLQSDEENIRSDCHRQDKSIATEEPVKSEIEAKKLLQRKKSHFENLPPTPKLTDSNTQTEVCKKKEPEKNEKIAEEASMDKKVFLEDVIKKTLSDVLHEGLLDSVLPYILPKPAISQPIIKKSTVEVKKSVSVSAAFEGKNGIIPSINKDKEKEKTKSSKKSLDEVEIHVCDESKNIKKDFRCPQKLLVQKMCYFADVTAGQKLEEMDISVHCDIVIFDWLMRWVKKDLIKKTEWPVLEANNVVPIMVSASFLQMEPLLENCLQFCHDNMPEVLKTSTNLMCLNDSLLTRLADLHTNIEVETLKDKKDKIQSRLFCKLIMSLAEPTPDNKKGHYSSLAAMFKCGKCGKNIVRSVSDSIPCIPSAMKIDAKGELHSKHTRDSSWTLNAYVINLRSDLRSWRKVYWRLWGDCHFLYCRECGVYFPINQMDWCSYHPEVPQFFTNEQQRSTPFPLGRYPCCSQRAYRFEALPSREGCKFKEHLPSVVSDKDINILNIFASHRDNIALNPPQLFFPEKITRLVARDPSLPPGKLSCKEPLWWEGIEIVPPRPKLGILGKVWGGSGLRRTCHSQDLQKMRKLKREISQGTENSSVASSESESDEEDFETGSGESSVDDESYYSEESYTLPRHKTPRYKKAFKSFIKRNEGGRCWSANLVTKYNQDNQRDFEERAATQMIALLTKRTSAEWGLLPKIGKQQGWKNASGGTYVRLEAEFRDQLTQSYKCKSSQGKTSTRLKSSKL